MNNVSYKVGQKQGHEVLSGVLSGLGGKIWEADKVSKSVVVKLYVQINQPLVTEIGEKFVRQLLRNLKL
jgi:hypothetical protein